ncbi:phage shock protein PspC (stress-responsive transcriptional regulator)/uncharacterized membrane protein [Dysgonomonas sp. PH5-45]|uniref:PspC domain-containing protein n=1 Tax=unclassified Dysgonomonas TaxID=2630389 RepID=UPI0024766C35|nr:MULTISPECIES: PspC domain-containing protein [unclassified Dysgonomonas]MDH6356004.1 phage shock protein PspC (stress-responsive transcriptional regulator)/uncharacterized membrane protein [Dysgonomonas sp. PH5-45]MDH6388899.1 phage shock protein PspC (stress-responsive transcriptional regulator)/uncharacterized membrane protein [Dysgonomonas sp. PH5-37]
MKKTLKVSIGGMAFSIDEDAYMVLDGYLNTLKDHYKNHEEGEEIINDVEARMGELLLIKIKNPQTVVTLTEAKEVARIMGNPSDFDDAPAAGEESDNDSHPVEEPSKTATRRRLYRDPENSVVGGVCSGLGYYFKVDPVFIRIAFVVLLLVTTPIAFSNGRGLDINGFIILAYIILWIAMPKAVTLPQRLAMMGLDPTVENVLNKDKNRVYYSPTGSKAGTTALLIIKVIISIIMILIGISFLISAVAFICWSFFEYPFSLSDVLGIVNLDTFGISFSLIAAMLIPAFIFFYLGIKLLSKIKKRDWVICGVATLVWVGTSVYLLATGIKTASQYAHSSEVDEVHNVTTGSDTLFVKLAPEYYKIEKEPGKEYTRIESEFLWENNGGQFFRTDNGKKRSLSFLPWIRVEAATDTTQTDYKLEAKKMVFARNSSFAQWKAEKQSLQYKVSGTDLYLSPATVNLENAIITELKITVPKSKTVIVAPPLEGMLYDQ